MSLSLDIMSIAWAFVVLDARAALPGPPREGRGAGPGSESRAKVQDGSPRNLGDPVVATSRVSERSTTSKRTRLARMVSASQERTRRQELGPGGETISAREQTAGSRSAFIVPMIAGNPARGDPTEEREAPCVRIRAWETRRVL